MSLVKLISALLRPLPIAVALLAIAWVQTWMRRKSAIYTLSAALIIILVTSLNLPAMTLVNHLEKPYAAIQNIPKNINTVVVLAAGVRGKKLGPANTQLSSTTLSRLVEGVRLYHLISDRQSARVILSGGNVFQTPRKNGPLSNTATMLGIAKKHLLITRGVQNTEAEATLIRPLVSKQPFLLVTSATHMQRAVWLFKQRGMHPIPAPTQFLQNRYHSYTGQSLIPSTSNMVRCDIALHEYLGTLWAKLRAYFTHH